jgi:hypothetical protein
MFKHPTRMHASRLIGSLLFTLAAASVAGAAVTYYSDQAAFLTASGAILHADFESNAVGPTAAFSSGSLHFDAVPSNLYILPAYSTDSNPTPSSRALAGNGNENIYISFMSGLGTVIGFTAASNRYGPPILEILAEDQTVLASFTVALAPNQSGFVGVISTTPFKWVRWLADGGQIQDTWIDDVYAADSATPAQDATWGEIKSLFR